MWRFGLCLVTGLCAMSLWPAETEISTRGRDLFDKRCTGCHSLDSIKVGPPLRGTFGHRAATDPKFPYSDALKKTAPVWDEVTLDKWLADPDALVPDNDMSFRLADAGERAAIVAYLKHLAANQGKH